MVTGGILPDSHWLTEFFFFFFYNSESHCWSFIDEYILSVFDIDFTAKTELEAQEKQLSDTQKM